MLGRALGKIGRPFDHADHVVVTALPSSGQLPVAVLFLLCVAAGFAVAQAQSLMLGTRMLSRPLGPVMLQARVANTERFPDGLREILTWRGCRRARRRAAPVCVCAAASL